MGLLIVGIANKSHSRSIQIEDLARSEVGLVEVVSWVGQKPNIEAASKPPWIALTSLALSAFATSLKASWTLALRHNRFDGVFVAHPSQLNVWLILPLAKFLGKRVIIDFYVGLEDTLALDRKTVPPSGFSIKVLRLMDKLALRVADHVVFDTRRNMKRFAPNSSQKGMAMSVIYPSPPKWFYDSTTTIERAKDLIFIGHFSPLQGLDIILEALADKRMQTIRATIVGSEAHSDFAKTAMALPNVVYIHDANFASFPSMIREHKIALGVFGKSDKAGAVLPNKVIEALSLSTPVITRTGCIEREFTKTGCVFIDPGDSNLLVETAIKLLMNNDLLRQLGQDAQTLHTRVLERNKQGMRDAVTSNPRTSDRQHPTGE